MQMIRDFSIFPPPSYSKPGTVSIFCYGWMSRTNMIGSGISTNFPLSTHSEPMYRQSSLFKSTLATVNVNWQTLIFITSPCSWLSSQIIHRLLPFNATSSPANVSVYLSIAYTIDTLPLLLSSPTPWLAMRQSNRSLLRNRTANWSWACSWNFLPHSAAPCMVVLAISILYKDL